MNTQIKHRMIGGLVLLALLAIFLPILFYHSHSPSQIQLSAKIPEAPKAPQIEMQLPVKAQTSENHPNFIQSATVISPQATFSNNQQPAIQQKVSTQEPKKTLSVNETNETSTQTNLTRPIQENNNVAFKQSSIQKNRILSDNKTDNKTIAIHANHPHPLLRTILNSKAWVLQLGTFKNQTNAKRLVKQLRLKGYDAYSRIKISKQSGRLVRVYVGPEIQLNKVQQIQIELKKEFKLNSVIKRYQI